MRTNRCLYPVTGLGWNLVALRNRLTRKEEERSQMIGWDLKTEVGTPFPSAEIDSKKDEFLSRVRSGQTNHSHFTLGGRQKNY